MMLGTTNIKYCSTLRTIPKDLSSHLHRDGSLRSPMVRSFFTVKWPVVIVLVTWFNIKKFCVLPHRACNVCCRSIKFILKGNYWLVFIMNMVFFLCMKSKLNFICHYDAWKGHSTVREGSADPRDKILELIWTAPVVQDKFCFNSPKNDVVNEILNCNSFITLLSVRLFRKRTSLSRFEIFRSLCPFSTVATIPTNHHAFSCHFLSYIFACASL